MGYKFFTYEDAVNSNLVSESCRFLINAINMEEQYMNYSYVKVINNIDDLKQNHFKIKSFGKNQKHHMIGEEKEKGLKYIMHIHTFQENEGIMRMEID